MRLKTAYVQQLPQTVNGPASVQKQHEGVLEHRWQGRLLAYEQDSPGPQVI